MSVKYITCLYTCDQKNIELVYLTRLSDQKSEEIGRNFRLAQRAAADAIVTWRRENYAEQPDLFLDSAPRSRWNGLGSGAGFCEMSRLYFAKLTERYLNYFLEREASAVIADLGARERFKNRLSAHVSEVSRHSFESAKITQSYAAGWFNKNALGTSPSNTQTKKFLAYAFEKLREEFRREGKQ